MWQLVTYCEVKVGVKTVLAQGCNQNAPYLFNLSEFQEAFVTKKSEIEFLEWLWKILRLAWTGK